MNKMKVLVTGGAGFIGSAIAKSLIDEHDVHVVALDSLLEQVHPTGEVPKSFDPRIEFVRGDVRDAKLLADLFLRFQPDLVAHLAAETGTAQSLTESTRHASVNVVGTTVLLDALNAAGCHPKRILLSSSRSVYGEGAWSTEEGHAFYPGRRSHKQLESGDWDFTGPDGQKALPFPHDAATTFPNPSSIYAATKLAQEHILGSWCEAYDVSLAILRFQNVYGPGQSPTNPYTGIINIFSRIAAAGGAIDVYEDGNIGRDFVFIDDVVRSCVAALMMDEGQAKIFGDIGFGQPTTILDAANIIAKLHDAPVPQVSGKFRDGDVRWAVADVSVMENVLGVAPSVGFEEGARRVNEWLRETGNL
jgi:dTDP-L-rhamnose 4-epimerase